jgi:transitional endoplasmic reticulum ATPase
MEEIDNLKHRVAKEPNNLDLYYKLSKAYIKANLISEAFEVLNKAVSLAPKNIDFRLFLAKTYVEQKEYILAKEQYQQILSLQPSHVMSHMNLGLLFEHYLKDLLRAAAQYERYVECGGNDPRMLKHIEELRRNTQTPQPRSHFVTNTMPRSITPQMTTMTGLGDELNQWRNRFTNVISDHKTALRKSLFASAMFLILLRCFVAFPVGHFFLVTLICLGLSGLTAQYPRTGIFSGLVLMFFPIAFHSPLLAYCYAAGAFFFFVIYVVERPGQAIVIMLVPLLLRMNLGYCVPLGGAILVGAGSGIGLGITAAIVGLCYMTARNIHQLGPLLVNYTGLPIAMNMNVEPGVFLKFQWMQSLISHELSGSFQHLLDSLWPALIQPPIVFVQIVSWGIAGYAAGEIYRKRSLLSLAFALAAGATVFLIQAAIVENLPGSQYYSSWPVAESLFFSAIAITVLVILKVGPQKAELAEDLGDVSWDSIGGLEDVKKEIQMVIQHQFGGRSSRLAKKYGLKATKGILFYGPPGCGKTLFAKALAKTAGASFFSVKGSDFRSKWYGETEQNLSEVFEQARRSTPSVIFFDEIDNMLGLRSETMTSDSPEKRIVALFLSEMDGVEPLGDVLVVGATNEPDLIDPAALRPGRFDKLIYIPLPDAKGREKIFQAHLMKKPLADDIDFQELAKMTERFSGADIADVCSKVVEQAVQKSVQSRHIVKISMAALKEQIKYSKPSVSLKSLRKYEELQEKYSRRTLRSQTGDAEEKQKYSWEQIGGLEHVKQELIEAIETPLKKPELYEKFGIKPPKGVLLYGPPGCGKTLMAKVIASQCSAHFLAVDIKKETSEGIKDWFIRARENKPSILFFDEIDSVGTSRDLVLSSGQGVTTQLLVELDGMEELKQIVVIAATNRPDQLDSALTRPGRFDRLIYIPPPDEKSRLEILKIHLKEKPVAEEVNLRQIAANTGNYSGADLAALCYEASMSLIRKSERPISLLQ